MGLTDALGWTSGLKIWRRELSCFLSSLGRVDRVKRVSIVKPRYLTCDALGTTEWFGKTGGQSPGRRGKVV